MRFPDYSPQIQAYGEPNLASAFMQLIGSAEQDHQAEIASLPAGDLRRASLMIGSACQIAQADLSAAKQGLQTVRSELASNYLATTLGSIERRKAVQLNDLALMLECGDNPADFNKVREDNHGHTVRALSSIDQKTRRLLGMRPSTEQKKQLNAATTERTEYRVQAMLSRMRHPWLFIAPSLPHLAYHQDGEFGRNFDHAVVEYNPQKENEPSLWRLQTKKNCFGECPSYNDDQEALEYRRQRLQEFRSRYNANITLISACCEMRIPHIDLRRVENFLLKEWQDKADQGMITTLDKVTHNITRIARNAEESGRSGLYAAK